MSPTQKEGACNVFRDREDGQLGMMAISHLLKRKEDGHLQPTEWKGGCHLLKRKELVMYSKGGRMATSHLLKREGGWSSPIFSKVRMMRVWMCVCACVSACVFTKPNHRS